MSGRTPTVTASPATKRSRILAVVIAAGPRCRAHRPFPTAEPPLVGVGLPLIAPVPPCGRRFLAILPDFAPGRHHRVAARSPAEWRPGSEGQEAERSRQARLPPAGRR